MSVCEMSVRRREATEEEEEKEKAAGAELKTKSHTMMWGKNLLL